MFERLNYFYTIDADHNIRCVNTMEEWAEAYSEDCRVVAQTGNANIFVSTVFLGIDHNFFGKGPPILFETMIFGGRMDDYQYRYRTYDEALAGHNMVVEELFKLVKGSL